MKVPTADVKDGTWAGLRLTTWNLGCYCSGMNDKPSTKAELALSFLSELANMRRDRLQEIIRTVVGEELATVMFNYARQVIEASPDKVLENASSLMILGYLINSHETGGIPPDNLPV